MSKKGKINWIKCWLQKFGKRDNETFNIKVTVGEITWEIALQYDYDFEGDKLDPRDWCCYSFKHLRNNSLSDRTEEELEAIIKQLKKKKLYH